MNKYNIVAINALHWLRYYSGKKHENHYHSTFHIYFLT